MGDRWRPATPPVRTHRPGARRARRALPGLAPVRRGGRACAEPRHRDTARRDGMITDYLLELVAELNVPLARRRRIVAEVEDHLHCAAAELHASGLDAEAAEREAVRRFGPARGPARTFHEDAAAT